MRVGWTCFKKGPFGIGALDVTKLVELAQPQLKGWQGREVPVPGWRVRKLVLAPDHLYVEAEPR